MQQRTRKYITYLPCIFLALIFGFAEAKEKDDDKAGEEDLNVSSYVIFTEEAGKGHFETDSLFFLHSLPIVFPVNSTQIDSSNVALQHFIHAAVPLLNSRDIRNARIRIRSAASPEGPLSNNQRLSRGRRDALLKIFETYGISASDVQIDVVDEEYELLIFNMRRAGDPDASLVASMFAEAEGNDQKMKQLLTRYEDGRLWARLKKEYYPALRSSRFMIIAPIETETSTSESYLYPQAIGALPPEWSFSMEPTASIETEIGDLPAVEYLAPLRRMPMLSVKSNLLQDVAYVPQYGFCPLWNVGVEYYPRRGHWTGGAQWDFPWWVGNTSNHKYFEVSNLQLEGRYYRHRGEDLWSQGKMPYSGLFVQGYLHYALYQIGFSATKGWVGEGMGGGLGLGYVLPLGQQSRWRLEFGAQLGLFVTRYDPFVYGMPVYHGGAIDGNYYYNTDLFRDTFVKRQHRYIWMGPTRVSVSLSYDLLHWRKQGRRPAFGRWEKGDGL